MQRDELGFSKLLRVAEILYLFLTGLAFYLLFESRAAEASTVWEVLNPALILVLFVATSLLTAIVLTSEKVAYKLMFVMIESVLIHSFFSIVFPVGDSSGQQMVLGRTRLIYDNAVLHGWPPWPIYSVQSRIYEFFRGENFQAAVSIVFARMSSIDLLWIHLSLVPILWGVFTPIAAYLVTSHLTENDKVPVLASLVVSALPYMTYFGAISVPNSLGFMFFFFSLYFMLKYLSSNDPKTTFLMLAFSFFAFLAHDLAGMMALALLILAGAFKSYKSERASSRTAKSSLLIAFVVSFSLLPLALINLRLFRPDTETVFTLDKFSQLPFQEIIGEFALGDLFYRSDLGYILSVIIGPLLAFLCMMYLVYHLRKTHNDKFAVQTYFLVASFLVTLINYRILKLFMFGVPFNGERLWVFRDFIAAPFIALAVYAVVSNFKSVKKAVTLPSIGIAGLGELSRNDARRVSGLSLLLTVLIPVVLGGWVVFSLNSSYPRVSALQTTWYELEAAKYIDATTPERYVVLGDIWTIWAGERIAGLNNPRAYYFGEYDKTGYDLFVKMCNNTSPQWMRSAMSYTNTSVAYFIISQPRLGLEQFHDVASRALQNGQLTVVSIPNVSQETLYVFSHRNE